MIVEHQAGLETEPVSSLYQISDIREPASNSNMKELKGMVIWRSMPAWFRSTIRMGILYLCCWMSLWIWCELIRQYLQLSEIVFRKSGVGRTRSTRPGAVEHETSSGCQVRVSVPSGAKAG